MSDLSKRLNNELAPGNTHYLIVGGLTAFGLVIACFSLLCHAPLCLGL
jgi:hypothetical protein